MKDPKCKICGGPHYKSFCFQLPKKPIATYKPLKRSTKPLTAKKPLNRSKPLKAVRKAQNGSTDRQLAIRELDRVFSIYIRTRDSINGLARCVTCGAIDSWKSTHNGHYISRGKFALRWDEKNCNVQCETCNVTLGGNLKAYKRYMARKYGSEIFLYLDNKLKQHDKILTYQIKEKIEYYKGKIKDKNA